MIDWTSSKDIPPAEEGKKIFDVAYKIAGIIEDECDTAEQAIGVLDGIRMEVAYRMDNVHRPFRGLFIVKKTPDKSGICAWEPCSAKVERFSERGKPYKYCSPECDKSATGKRLADSRKADL